MMNKRNQSYAKIKCLIFFIIVGLLLPYSIVAQDLNKSLLPTIPSFKAIHETTDGVNDTKVNWIEFSWETKSANRVRLYKEGVEIKSRSQLSNGEIGWPLSMARGYKTQYNKPTIYELVAENDKGKVSKKLSVKLKKEIITPISIQPKILDFRAEPQNIKSGEQVSFYWLAKNAYQVRLYDSFGEIKSRIKLPKGNFGWPLAMNGAYSEDLNKSETYKLVVTGKNGSVSRSVKVSVSDKKCRLNVSITGKYSKNTDGIGVFEVIPGSVNKFLFKRPVNRFSKKNNTSESAINLLPGNYYLAPYGGGKDKHGNFGVIFKPRNIHYTCKNGNSKYITIKADFAEY